MTRGKRIAIVSAMLFIYGIALGFAPRFGWEMSDGTFQPFRYAGTARAEGRFVDMYRAEDGDVLKIAYRHRLALELDVLFPNGQRAALHTRIDGGSGPVTTPEAEKYGALQPFLMSEIIWKDSGGIFYHRYLLSLAAMVGYALLLRRTKLDYRAWRTWLAVALFVVAMLISLRIIM